MHSEVYIRARHYATAEERWTGFDPLWPRQPSYSYVAGGPSGRTDSSGLESYCCCPGSVTNGNVTKYNGTTIETSPACTPMPQITLKNFAGLTCNKVISFNNKLATAQWHGLPGVNGCLLSWWEWNTHTKGWAGGPLLPGPTWTDYQNCYWFTGTCLTAQDAPGQQSCGIFDPIGTPMATILAAIAGFSLPVTYTFESCQKLTLAPGCIGAIPPSCKQITVYFKTTVTTKFVSSSAPPTVSSNIANSTSNCQPNEYPVS
jgi:hypothetical protein